MEKFGKSQSVTRKEDVRLLTGAGRYVDDIAPEGALFAVFLRSPVAHARLTGIDAADAREMPGVQMVMTAAEVDEMGADNTVAFVPGTNADGTPGAQPPRPFLATDRLRFVGEPVAMVVAETLAQAKDAAEAIMLETDDLDPHIALAPGGEALHDEAPDNIALDFALGEKEATDAAFAKAAHTVKLTLDDHRVIVNSMEPRGCFAEMDGDRLHLCFGGQGVWAIKAQLVRALKMPEDAIRVSTPDVGGGFGMKGFAYPEYFPVALAARALGRPVRWMSDRTEAMLSDNGGRDLVSEAEMAFDADHKLLGYRVHNTFNLGAYCSNFGQLIQTMLFSRVLMGTYECQAAHLTAQAIFTNTAPVDAYRGAGRPEAIYVVERMMDYAARELGVDPWDLRRKNFIPADRFPYTSVTGETYDVGDFTRVLDRAEVLSDREGFAARRAASEAQGKLRGLGVAYYIESILGSPEEDSTVEFNEDGTVTLYSGTQSNGQGHETVYAQFLSDQTGIPAELIEVVQGDSDRIKKGGGTGGSRSVTVQNNATLAAVGTMVERYSAFLADEMGVDPAQVSFDDERFRAEGSNVSPTFLEAAGMARAAGRSDLLRITETATLPARSYPNGAHVAEIEIDRATGVLTVARYTVVDDFGNLINPMLAEGQVHGGVAQGLGQAVLEHAIYDETGQPLTATFMDYGMPRADNLPMIDFTPLPVPSTANPMGMKGCGEAGTVGALPALGNAVMDALWPLGVRRADMPFTPLRIWQMLEAADGTQVAAE